jgi:hypothetical protein
MAATKQEQSERGELNQWLRAQLRTYHTDGDALIGGWKKNGITWLLHELVRRGDVELAAAFRARRNARKTEQYWELRQIKLRRLEERITRLERELGSFALYQLDPLRDEANKLRRSIIKHEEAHAHAR